MTKYVKRCLNSTHCQVDKYTKGKREEIKDDDGSEPWTSLSECISQTKALRQRLGLHGYNIQ